VRGTTVRMKAAVTEEIIARQPPEARAIIRALLAEIGELKARIEELERQVKGKTPQNSCLSSVPDRVAPGGFPPGAPTDPNVRN